MADVELDLESVSSIKETVDEVKKYIEEIKGGKITCRADLRVGIIPIKDIGFEDIKVPVVFIRCNNPIFKIMCTQTEKEWVSRKWLYSGYFPIKITDTDAEIDRNITKTQANSRFGLIEKNPISLVGSFFVKKITSFLQSFQPSEEYLLAVVDLDAFENVCDEIYKHMTPYISVQ